MTRAEIESEWKEHLIRTGGCQRPTERVAKSGVMKLDKIGPEHTYLSANDRNSLATTTARRKLGPKHERPMIVYSIGKIDKQKNGGTRTWTKVPRVLN